MSAIAGLKPALPETIVRFLNAFVLDVLGIMMKRVFYERNGNGNENVFASE